MDNAGRVGGVIIRDSDGDRSTGRNLIENREKCIEMGYDMFGDVSYTARKRGIIRAPGSGKVSRTCESRSFD
jgi:hypothetical protein